LDFYDSSKIYSNRKNKSIRFEYILDEGGALVYGIIDGIKKPIATLGISEKGYLSLQLSTSIDGGHSSMPKKESAIGVLSKAVSNLESNQLPESFSGPVKKFIEILATESPLINKMVLSNLWLFEPVVLSIFRKTPILHCHVRTTTAPTIIKAGIKDNVLAKNAMAVVNFRIKPGETTETVIKHVHRVINDDRVIVSHYGSIRVNPPAESSTDSLGYELVTETITELFPDAIITPYTVIGATDARYFSELSDSVYRFVPLKLMPGDTIKIHGTNERIAVENYKQYIHFYAHLIMRSQDNGEQGKKRDEL